MCLLCENTWDGQHRIGCWYWLCSVDSNQLIRSTASFSSQVLSYSVLRCQQGCETLPKSSPHLALMNHLGGEAYWCCEVNWRKVTLNQEVSSLLSFLPSHLLPPLSPPSLLPSLSSLPLLFDYIPTEQLEGWNWVVPPVLKGKVSTDHWGWELPVDCWHSQVLPT